MLSSFSFALLVYEVVLYSNYIYYCSNIHIDIVKLGQARGSELALN